jgi:hypothetical protein
MIVVCDEGLRFPTSNTGYNLIAETNRETGEHFGVRTASNCRVEGDQRAWLVFSHPDLPEVAIDYPTLRRLDPEGLFVAPWNPTVAPWNPTLAGLAYFKIVCATQPYAVIKRLFEDAQKKSHESGYDDGVRANQQSMRRALGLR